MLKGKIHRATVVQAALDYVGSITIDEDLMDSAGILEYEKVEIVDIDNGNRFATSTRSSSCATARLHPKKQRSITPTSYLLTRTTNLSA